jgi:RNA-binding protein Tab2/Atab2
VASVPQSSTWELDFCSRPMLDVRGKKVWELLICDPSGKWAFSKYFPNNKINSTELKAALKEVLATEGAKRPKRVLFFRGQMQTIISRALQDLDIQAVPSRRCFTLMKLLNDRLENVYKQDERYTESAGTMFQLDLAPPTELADALRGEQWAFVQLPLSALRSELQPLEEGTMFGASLPNLGDLGLSEDAMVPGVAVFSKRAGPLAAWTNGLQLACLKADVDRACLLLETGVRDRYKYGAWRRSKAANDEAVAWEQAKVESHGLHFLAVQTHPDADECTGIWLLRDMPPPEV